MQVYKNLSGNSGVTHYKFLFDENTLDSIQVQFKTGAIYLYSIRSCGENNLLEMQSKAFAGRGLDTYISKHVKKKYAAILQHGTKKQKKRNASRK